MYNNTRLRKLSSESVQLEHSCHIRKMNMFNTSRRRRSARDPGLDHSFFLQPAFISLPSSTTLYQTYVHSDRTVWGRETPSFQCPCPSVSLRLAKLGVLISSRTSYEVSGKSDGNPGQFSAKGVCIPTDIPLQWFSSMVCHLICP